MNDHAGYPTVGAVLGSSEESGTSNDAEKGDGGAGEGQCGERRAEREGGARG